MSNVLREVSYSRLPEHMREGAKNYVEYRIAPGGFMTAVLCNNLVDAFVRADDINIVHLRHWAAWLMYDCPHDAWGSPAKVRAWLAQEPKDML